jgi:DNA-binding NarL/FixJ family response regulator
MTSFTSEICILLIADNAPLQHAVTNFLKRDQDLSVIDMHPGEDNDLSDIKNLDPQVILLDLDRPETNGLVTIQRLRTTFPETAIIALSFVDGQSYQRVTLNAGADAFIRKAEMGNQLIPAIHRLVQNHRPRSG